MSMSLPFELQIALRYLVARRKQTFISTISLVSILGVAVGVMALVIALALMTGLQQELRDRIVGSSAHVYVYKVTGGGITDYQAEVQQLLGVPHVLGAAPAMLGKALVTTGATQAFITIKGIDPVLEATVTEVAQAVRHGSLDALVGDEGASLGGVVLGEDLASSLGKFVGDHVTLVTPQGTLSPMGIIPRQMRLRVVGIFRLGLFEFDTSYGFVSLDVARRLLHRDPVDLIGLRVDDMYAAPEVAKSVTEMLGPGYLTQDWSQQNQALFSALWIEKMAISIAIGLIVMVAALNIIASLILLVMEKNRDIAILKTMGAGSRSILGIFMLQGAIIGVVGTTVGAVGGYLVSTIVDRYRLLPVPIDVYQVSYVPFTIETLDFVLVIVSALVVCFLATIYPSRQASRLDPAQALRYQ